MQMDDERILKINYRANCVELKIDDVDKCLLIDVFNDMIEEFANRGFELPEFPGLHYCYKGKAINLVDDGTMMKMFETIESKEIDLWVDCLSKPSFILNLVRTVKPQQILAKPSNAIGPASASNPSSSSGPPVIAGPSTSTGPPSASPQEACNAGPSNPTTFKPRPPKSFRPKLPTRKNKQTLQAEHHSIESGVLTVGETVRRSPRLLQSFSPPKVTPPLSQPSRLPRILEDISPYSPPHITLSADAFFYSNNFASELSPHAPRRSPRLLQGIPSPNLRQAPLNPPPQKNQNEPPIEPMRTRSCQSKVIPFPHGKKMPNTTARLKGLFIPCRQRSQTVPEDETGRGCRKRGVGGAQSNYVAGVHSDDGSSSESDGEYIPGEQEDIENESEGEDGEPDEVEENMADLLHQNYVDGGWEPFRCNEKVYELDGGYISKLYNNGEVYDDAEIGRIALRPWQLFVDRDHFKDALRDFCIQEGFSLVVRKAEHDRYTAECADSRCRWRIHASVLLDGITWAIKSIKHGHTCDMNMVNNPMANCKWAAKKLVEDIRASPHIRGKALNQLLWERFGVKMATSSLYKMKNIAMEIIQGGHDESYFNLNVYCHLLKERNPGSVAFCTWRTVQQPEHGLQFKSIFISFAAQFQGLIQGCRGLVGVDGCHLKGNYGGILLSAVALDGNNEIFPVAVAVVDSENKSSWSWFFHHLKNILTGTGRVDWTIMLDRQKGIDPSLDQVWPTVPRRYCARHLCKNFKTEYPGLLMHKLFWGVTNAYSAFCFKKSLEKIKSTAGVGAIKWFKDVGPLDRWTRWKFDCQLSSNENTNNFVESFNNTIGVDRSCPILTLLEGVRRIAMVRHATRQQIADQWEEGICPNIRERVRVLIKESRKCHAYPSGRGEYEVSDGRSMLPVSLNSWSCVCGRWQVSGIPCRHGIRAILDAGKDPNDYVREWYSVARYKLSYSGNILPIPDPGQWPEMDLPKLLPPPMKRSVGRPSRNRRREEGEKRKGKRSANVQCSNCKQFGHNLATCKGGPTKKEMLEQQGKTATTTTTTTRKAKRNTHQASQNDSEPNFIDQMIRMSSNHAGGECSSQPVLRKRHKQSATEGPFSQPAPATSASMHESISPKRQKIMSRLAML